MKTIFLGDMDNIVTFQCENTTELRSELAKHDISPGDELSIGDTVYIGRGVSIGEGVSILDEVSIDDRVHIGNRVFIGNKALIQNGAFIGNGVHIGDGAVIGERVYIGDGASIDENVVLSRTFHLVGSMHSITYTGNGTLSIGCHHKQISWWQKYYKAVGKKANYTDEEIEEYRKYIELAKQFAKIVERKK